MPCDLSGKAISSLNNPIHGAWERHGPRAVLNAVKRLANAYDSRI